MCSRLIILATFYVHDVGNVISYFQKTSHQLILALDADNCDLYALFIYGCNTWRVNFYQAAVGLYDYNRFAHFLHTQ